MTHLESHSEITDRKQWVKLPISLFLWLDIYKVETLTNESPHKLI